MAKWWHNMILQSPKCTFNFVKNLCCFKVTVPPIGPSQVDKEMLFPRLAMNLTGLHEPWPQSHQTPWAHLGWAAMPTVSQVSSTIICAWPHWHFGVWIGLKSLQPCSKTQNLTEALPKAWMLSVMFGCLHNTIRINMKSVHCRALGLQFIFIFVC